MLNEGDRTVWQVCCECGYYAIAQTSSGWDGPVPPPPKQCPECGRHVRVFSRSKESRATRRRRYRE